MVLEDTLLLLKVYVLLVEVLDATLMTLPEKFAAVMLYFMVTILLLVVGSPVAETVTEVPATTADGEIVTVGFVIVKVPATTEVAASEIITVCEPAVRLQITKYPDRTPFASVFS